MNYIESLLNQETIMSNNSIKVLETNEMLINLTDATKRLNTLQEAIVKTIYLSKIFFLEELVLLYSFPSCKQSIEKAILDLERMDYIKSLTTEWGKALCLTSKGISQIKKNPFISVTNEFDIPSINADEFNSHMLKYKILSAELSHTIFVTFLIAIIKRFLGEDITFRKRYAKIQFVKNYLYKDFLKLTSAEKKTHLEHLFTDEEVIKRYSSLTLYSNTFAIQYAQAYLTQNYDTIDTTEDFQDFRSYMNKHCLRILNDSITSFHFLRDYFNSLNYDKDTIVKQIYQLLYQRNSNFLRTKEITIRRQLLSKEGATNLLKAEALFYQYNQKYKLFDIKRRNLIKQYKNKTDVQENLLDCTNQKIQLLENEIAKTNEKLTVYKELLGLLLYANTRDNGLDIFKESIITLDSLRQSGIYIGQIQESVITYCIVPFDNNSFTYTSLFKKIEKTFVFSRFVLPNYHLTIKICCYGEASVKEVRKLLKKVKDKYSDIKEYQILATDFHNIVTVHNMEFHFKERYEVFPLSRNVINQDEFNQ